MNDVSTQIPVAEQFYSVQGEQSFNALHSIELCVPEEYDCFWCDDGTKELYPSEREERDRVFCSTECRSEWMSETQSGEGNPRYDRTTVECDVCGVTKEMWPSQAEEYDHHFCSDECEGEWRSNLFSGENNPVWAGGYAPYYGSDWNSKREEVVERDGDECRVCGITADELGKSVDVHHIEPVSSFDDPNKAHSLDNMIQLCPTCHVQAEHDKIEVPEP